ncbi:hypothetical protein ACFVT2_32480 [Streptomyces sp. NPDC058000]|uniref:hypothetical protein n=1 Tax=Streptomyces sp. NPDC058000 TaxID=3346299 RepID=UPI0036E21EB8
MSETTLDTPHTPHPTTAPAPLTDLTGSHAAIYTELTSLTEPATVTELALAAGIGHSTAGRALTILEKRGLAARTPGGHDGPRRTPDLWRLAPNDKAISSDGNSHSPGNNESTPSTTNTPALSATDAPEPVGNETGNSESSVDNAGSVALTTQSVDSETQPDAPDPAPHADPTHDTTSAAAAADQPDPDNTQPAPDTEGTNPTTRQETAVAPRELGQNAEHDKSDDGDDKAPAPQAASEPSTKPADAITLPSAKRRLAPGALRHMVIDHLQAHPDEAFTATKISRIIGRSSGAIANSLDKLASQGTVEQVSDRPRMFRLAASAPADNSQ